jgi:hypothetical protein
MLKESLVKFIILSSGLICLAFCQTNLKEEEKMVINLICKEEKVENVSDIRLRWSDYGFINYKKLNHENVVYYDRGEFELNLWFNEAQKTELTQKVRSVKPSRIQKKDLPDNVKLITEDYGQLRRTVYRTYFSRRKKWN